MRWSRNHAAHVDTWFALRILEQTRKPFAAAGSVKVTRLLFYNASASAKARRNSARVLARQLHNVFVDAFGSELEKNVTKTRAVNAMVSVLVDPKRTIANLAEINDGHYRFLDEDVT